MDYLSSVDIASNPATYQDEATKLSAFPKYSQPFIHPAEHTAFLSLMLSTIDTNKLSENYFQYLAGKLPLKGLSFASSNEVFEFGKIKQNSIKIQLPTSSNVSANEHLANTISYHFIRHISMNEQQYLHELHTHFCVPLSHTLAYRQLQAQATRDRLTGLGNRAAFDEQMLRMLSQLQRHNTPFALLVIDLDNFKQVNDKNGHQEGDSVLMVVAQQLRNSLRDEDVAFRFGGDEFCCLLNGIDPQQLGVVAERIRSAIAGHTFLRRHKVSASIGATMAITSDDSISIFKRADAGLYNVKAKNKDGVSITD